MTRVRLAALVLLLAACGPGVPEPVYLPTEGDPLPEEAAFLAAVDRSRGFKDCFEVLRDPVLVPAAQAPRMRPEELVIGLDLGRVQVAYPVLYLNYHEIVEHELEGLSLLVCW